GSGEHHPLATLEQARGLVPGRQRGEGIGSDYVVQLRLAMPGRNPAHLVEGVGGAQRVLAGDSERKPVAFALQCERNHRVAICKAGVWRMAVPRTLSGNE